MSWEKYYTEKLPVPFGRQKRGYKEAIFYHNKDIINYEDQIIFLLGGFHPKVKSHKHFLDLCQEINNNNKNLSIFMDMNSDPFKDDDVRKHPLKVQCQLENMPFKNCIDYLFLDFTFDLMNEKQITDFSNSVKNVLNKNGIVIATLTYGGANFKNQFKNLINENLHCELHSPQKIKDLVSNNLKTTLLAEYNEKSLICYYLIAMSRKDSDYNEFPDNDIKLFHIK